MISRKLNVFVDTILVGQPTEDNNLWAFQYHTDWLASEMISVTRLTLFKWAVFNALVGNGDAHLKNLLFFITSGDAVLTPHYDLLSTIIYARVGNHMHEKLSQPMGNATTFGELTQTDVMAFANALNIPDNLAKRELQQLLAKVPVQADKLFHLVQSLPWHHGMAGELRMLRQICTLAIGEMVQRLSAPA